MGNVFILIIMIGILLYVVYEAFSSYREERRLKRILNERRSGGAQWKL